MRTCTYLGFEPATYGGIYAELVTEKGFFFMFSITEDLSDLHYHYAETGNKADIEFKNDLVANRGEDFYWSLKPHLQEVLREFGLDKKAAVLYDKWKKKYQ